MSGIEGRPQPAALPGITSKDLGEEYLFYDKSGNRVHVLNGTARCIYLLCQGDRTVDEVIAEVVTLYEVDSATARDDARETIESLVRLGLLTLE